MIDAHRPTNEDLNTTLETLEYLLEYLIINEPYAKGTINNFEQVIEELPREISEVPL